MHQLAEGEVDEQHADERDMGEEQGVQAHGGLRREVQDAHDEHLGLRDVDLVEVAHTDAGADDAHDEEQREIVVGEGDVAHFRVRQATAEEEQDSHHDEHVGHEQARHADLHDAVVTAVVNKRAGGMGLISGRKAFQKPMKDGIQLLNTIQDVYLDSSITIA